MKIKVSEVVVPEGRRRIGDVSELAKSIAEVGLLNPITVRRTDGGFVLVAGGHRLEAVKSLGWEDVPCVVVDLCEMRAELAELDENLLRNEGTALERGEWMARRKVVYELLHPDAAHGKAPVGRGGKKEDEIISSSFADDTASKIGQSGRTIQHDVQIGSMPEAVRETLRETPAADRKVDLLKLARVKEPEDQQAIAEKMADGVRFDEAIKKAHVSHNSGNNEWYTPREYIDAARAAMGSIDLDPATSEAANEVVGAPTYYTQDDDGLEQEWKGNVWMNPPYASGLVDRFAAKLAHDFASASVSAAIVLVNNATDTRWWATLTEHASAVCFPTGRIRFWAPGRDSAAPLQGQAIVYMGDDVDAFAREFARFGRVWL